MEPDPNDAVQRAERLTDLFSDGVVGYELRSPAPASWLLPEEAPFGAGAVPKRVSDFAGGRVCARRALEILGVRGFPILVGNRRAPIWPRTIVGSISHTGGYCGAVACHRARFGGIGFDVERRGHAMHKLASMFCTAEEIRWLDAIEATGYDDMATLVFSAKEAFYKAQFCLTGAWLDFTDIALDIDREGGSFGVSIRKPIPEFAERGGRLRGRFAFSAEHVYTGIAIASEAPS